MMLTRSHNASTSVQIADRCYGAEQRENDTRYAPRQERGRDPGFAR